VAKVKENAAKCVEKILEASRKTGAPMGMKGQTPGGGMPCLSVALGLLLSRL